MRNLISFINLLMLQHIYMNMIAADFQLYDAGMEHLMSDTPYYIVPVRSGNGGGLWLYEDNGTCSVAQISIDDVPSQAVIFNHEVPEDRNWLTEFKDLNIRFENPYYTCNDSSSVFQVDNYNEAAGKYYITTGGVRGNPGCGTITSWFQIAKTAGEYSYKLVYCPRVCGLVNVTCRDVGTWRETSFPRLVLSDDQPLLVRFHKAHPCGSNKL